MVPVVDGEAELLQCTERKNIQGHFLFKHTRVVQYTVRSYTFMGGNERGFLLLFFRRNLEEGGGGAHVGETRLGQVFRERGR